jgi:hypothetical protein
MKNSLVDLYNDICADITTLRDRNLTGVTLQEEVDRSLAVSRLRELQMNFIGMMIKTADTMMTLDPDLNLNLSALPLFETQPNNEPKIASGRRPLLSKRDK